VLRYAVVSVLALTAIVSISRQPAQAARCQPALRSVTLASPSVPGGASDAMKVTLSCAAPTAVSVKLRGFTGVTVPTEVLIARDKTSATATVRSAVSKVTRSGMITARLGRGRHSAALTVTRTPRTCKSPTITGMSLVSLAYVGDRPAATIRLSCAPLKRVRLAFSSSSTNVPVPATVAVGQYYDYARLTLAPKAYEPGQYAATIKVRYGSRSVSRRITIDPGLSLIQIPAVSNSPDDVVLNVLFTGQIPAGGETVRLTSSNAAVIVPASYTFPAPSLGGEVTGITVQGVTQNTNVTLSATIGSVTMTARTVLLPPFDSQDTATIYNTNAPGPIYGLSGQTSDYEVQLSNPAPASGLSFDVTSGSTDLAVVNPQFIDAGSNAAYFTVTTPLVTTAVHTTLSAVIDGVAASVTVDIEPPMSAFAGVPTTVTSGQSFTVTLQMFGVVDIPTIVDLNAGAGLTMPASVTVPAGQNSVSFTATAPTVTTSEQDFIYAMIVTNSQVEDTLQSPTITVNP
jgi:hypothetical protein